MTDFIPLVDVLEQLRDAQQASGLKQYQWAKEHHFSAAYLSQVLNNLKAPSERLCSIIGIVKVATPSGCRYFRPIKVLNEQNPRSAATG